MPSDQARHGDNLGGCRPAARRARGPVAAAIRAPARARRGLRGRSAELTRDAMAAGPCREIGRNGSASGTDGTDQPPRCRRCGSDADCRVVRDDAFECDLPMRDVPAEVAAHLQEPRAGALERLKGGSRSHGRGHATAHGCLRAPASRPCSGRGGSIGGTRPAATSGVSAAMRCGPRQGSRPDPARAGARSAGVQSSSRSAAVAVW